MEKNCEICGEVFHCYPYQAETRKTCSPQCNGKLKTRRSSVVLKCVVCGRLFVAMKWIAGKRKTCSPQCNGKRLRDRIVKRCYVCSREFEVPKSRRNLRRYCSHECLSKTKRKVLNRPNAEQLRYLLNRMTLKKLSEMYRVSINSIRLWCKYAGVHVPSKKERYQLKKLNRIGVDPEKRGYGKV